jgi:ABC-type multidrug transport system fused ATPase/permease subunit
MKYRPTLPLVLKNLSFEIKEGEKVGIVGRTGAGKTSIIQALFRMLEPTPDSKYEIDSFDVLQMGLHSLRQHISVIPQTPFIFKGTIRQNLDPFKTKKKPELWKALEDAGLLDAVRQVNII